MYRILRNCIIKAKPSHHSLSISLISSAKIDLPNYISIIYHKQYRIHVSVFELVKLDYSTTNNLLLPRFYQHESMNMQSASVHPAVMGTWWNDTRNKIVACHHLLKMHCILPKKMRPCMSEFLYQLRECEVF
jgi:hypothetical protein